MLNWLLDILFPKKCIGCKREGIYFCDECVLSILQTDLFCPRCEDKSIGGLTHPHCERSFGLDGLWSLGLYKGPLKKAIRLLKYERVRQLVLTLTDILLKYWVKHQPFVLEQIKHDQGKGWVVVPVPLHWFKENSRGFNQSDLIGKLLAKKLDLGFCHGLKRVTFTPPQVGLKRQDRKNNIRRAFAVTPDYKPDMMNSVLLIDDVWTTGATLKECCFILKQAGAKKVWAITLAC